MAKHVSSNRNPRARKARAKKRAETNLTKYQVTMFTGGGRVTEEVWARDDVEAIRKAKAQFLAQVTRDINAASVMVQDLTPPANQPQPTSLARASGTVEVTPLGDPAYATNPFAEAAAEMRESIDHPVDHTSGLRAALAGDDGLTDAERAESAERFEAKMTKGGDSIERPRKDGSQVRDVLPVPAMSWPDGPPPAERQPQVRKRHNGSGPAFAPGDQVWLISASKTNTVHVSQAQGAEAPVGKLAWCGIKPEFRHAFDLDDYANVTCPKCKAAVAANQTRARGA